MCWFFYQSLFYWVSSRTNCCSDAFFDPVASCSAEKKNFFIFSASAAFVFYHFIYSSFYPLSGICLLAGICVLALVGKSHLFFPPECKYPADYDISYPANA